MPTKINHAILHIFDFVSCENTFAQEEIDLTSKNAKNFVTKHAVKALTCLDNKRGTFAPESGFAEELRAYYAGQRDFVELSQQIGDFLVTELGHMEKTPSTDLLVVDFEDEPVKAVNEMSDEEVEASFKGRANRYFAILLLESKQAYMHEMGFGEVGPMNTVVRQHAVLPNPSQKVPSYAVIDLRTLEVQFADKKRVIAGEERWLIPDGLLQCSMEASSKETLTAVTEIVEAVAEEYGANTAVAMSKAKAYAAESVEEYDYEDRVEVDIEQLAEEVFEDQPELKKRFVEAVHEQELPERVPLEREAVKKVTRNHRIVTDTGIQITFPAEYSKSPEFITFTNEADGSISISLKNISHIENR
ncbi:MAG: nucleoid-associated protein [Coriobacteriia bacterium]|nr:nucleoid-associated protein [Coriobacteriia bacterium]